MGDYYINILLKKEKKKPQHFRKCSPWKIRETTLGQLAMCGSNQIKKQGSYVCEAGVLMTKTCLNSGC